MPKVQTTKVFTTIQHAMSAGYTTVSEQGSSRCFGKGTLVRMYDGRLKPVECISVGDRLMNIDGNGYNTVIEVHNGIDKLYKVCQCRGIDYTVNSKHILSLRQTRAKQHKVAIAGYKSAEKRRIEMLPFDKDRIHDFDIEFYCAQSNNFRKKYSGFKHTRLEFGSNELPIDPYYFGAWIGDGCSHRYYEITNVDEEIIDWFYDFAKSLDTYAERIDNVTHRIKVSTKRLCTPVNDKVGALKKYFYENNLIDNKHIPDCFLYSSYENRLKLLAGIIDTDGSQTGRNTIEITQKNERIIDALVEICHTSGFYTNGKRSKITTMKRSDGSIYKCKTYSIEINHNDFNDLNRFIKIPRKRIKKYCERNYWSTSIDIQDAGFGEFYGFTLDNSPYFLLEDGTVVHNSGKTFNTVLWLCVYANNNHNKMISIVRATLPALKGSVLRDFKENMRNLGLWNERSFNKSELMYTFENGSQVEFFSCDNEQKLRGRKRNVLYVNEGNELRFIEWQQLQMRTTEFSIIDYNPSFTDEHWLCQLNKEDKTYHFISTYKDNPFLEKKVIDEIESLKTKNPSLWRVYGLGLQAIIEGLVFENIEIIEEIPRWVKKHGYIGIDFGYAHDPTAAEEVWIHGDCLYIDEVFNKTHMLTEEIIEALKAHNREAKKEFEIISESADPRLIDEIYNAGLDIKPVHKFGGSVMAGIQKMQEFRIKITRRSVNVIKEFKNYTYRQDKEGKWMNEPIDAYNHHIDSIRYVVLEKVLGVDGEALDAEGIIDIL